MERYRELNKDMERLNEWRQNHMDTRETYLQMSSQLAQRRRQLISELSLIYSIRQVPPSKKKKKKIFEYIKRLTFFLIS